MHTNRSLLGYMLRPKPATAIAFALIGILIFVFSNSVFDPFIGNGSKPSQQPIPVSQEPDAVTKAKVRASLMRLPLSFEANEGQTDAQVKFLSRGGNHSVFFTPDKIVMSLVGHGPEQAEKPGQIKRASFPPPPAKRSGGGARHGEWLELHPVGGNADPEIVGEAEMPNKSNYFRGNDPTKWHSNVANYGKVRYKEVYPGIDLVFYGNQGQMEFDFVVAPGADPNVIRMAVSDGTELKLADNGDLRMKVGESEIVFHAPVVYQCSLNGENPPQSPFDKGGSWRQGDFCGSPTPVAASGGVGAPTASGASTPLPPHRGVETPQLDSRLRGNDGNIAPTTSGGVGPTPVEGRFALLRDGHGFAFRLGQYDKSLPLVIDPSLSFSTYLGGSANDTGNGIAVDTTGNVYVTGYTQSTDFPRASAYDSTLGGTQDVFVTKFNATGSALTFSTYLGGSSDENGYGIAVDSAGNVYVTGFTQSSNFPTTTGAYDTTLGGTLDAFVTKLNPTGSALTFSTYLGGLLGDSGNGIAVDSAGSVYVTGYTQSSDFPTASAYDTTLGGTYDVFVTKFNSTGTALTFSTFLGGLAIDFGYGIAVDSSNNVYVTGYTQSSDFPTASAYDTTLGGGQDAFVTKFNSSGVVVFSTYLGGLSDDIGKSIAVDSSGNVYVAGWTYSSDFPKASAYDSTLGGSQDAFVTKFNSSGSALTFSTYLGGSLNDGGYGIAVDSSGNVYVAGFTTSSDFPTTTGAYDTTLGGTQDVFVTKLNAAGSALTFSTYLGGSANDSGYGIAVDSFRNIYVTGETPSGDFPTARAYDTTLGGTYDAFATKFDMSDPSTPTPSIAFTSASSSGTESTTTVNLAVSLSNAYVSDVSVNYAVTGGTATGNGVDYTLSSGTLTIPVGSTTGNITLLVVNDALIESSETVIVTLSSPTNATLGTNTSCTYTITDDDTIAPTIAFTARNAHKVISPYWQADQNIFTFVAISHPSLSNMSSQIGVRTYAINNNGATLFGSTEFTVSAGTTKRMYIVTPGSSLNSTSTPNNEFIVGAASSSLGTLIFNPVASNPEKLLPTATGGGYPDITALSFWGAIVVGGTLTGFAIEFIGDAHDSAVTGATNNVATASGLN